MHGLRTICLWNVGTAAYGSGVVQGACDYAQWAQDIIVVRPSPFDTASADVRDLRQYDGALVMVPDRVTDGKLARLGVPCISVFHRIHNGRLPRVGQDEQVVGRLAAQHFIERGYRRFAYLRAPGHAFSDEREASFKDALRADGRELAHVWPETEGEADGNPWERLYKNTDAAGKWLAELPKPVALLAANDVFAHFAAVGAVLAGIAVPEEIAILGVDNDTVLCQSTHVPLSSVAAPARRIGWVAAELLDKMIAGTPSPFGPVLIPPAEVITRRSTELIAITEPGVARALQYISRNAAKPLSVHSIAGAAQMSRRTLENRFRHLLGRSPMAEVRRVRLAVAKHLLLTTTLPVYLIADRVGYASQEHFCSLFKRNTGLTPTQFRTTHGHRSC